MPLVTVWVTPRGTHFHLDQYCYRVHRFIQPRMKPESWDTTTLTADLDEKDWCSGCAKPIQRWWEKP